MKAIEIAGKIDHQGLLKIDAPLQMHNKRVKVIILVLDDEDEMEDTLWLKGISTNPVFDFLEGEEEDIYSIKDGEPILIN